MPEYCRGCKRVRVDFIEARGCRRYPVEATPRLMVPNPDIDLNSSREGGVLLSLLERGNVRAIGVRSLDWVTGRLVVRGQERRVREQLQVRGVSVWIPHHESECTQYRKPDASLEPKKQERGLF